MVDPRKLSFRWNRRCNDYLYRYPRKCDGWLLYSMMQDLVRELGNRGYDPKTIRFEVRLKDGVDIND